MNIAVTGSSGFIGTCLVSALKRKGYYIQEISLETGINLLDWDALKVLDEADVIVHLAARTFVPDSFKNPRDFFLINHTTTLNALELARLWNAKFIFMSSYLYGTPNYLPIDENHEISPHNPYAQSKWLSEELIRGYNRDFNVPATIFRLFNVYGPNQTGDFLIPKIISQLEGGKIILNDPRPRRDFIHLYDVVDAIIKSLEIPTGSFNIFNLGSNASTSINELVDLILSASGKNAETTFRNIFRKGEVLETIADISKIKNSLAWEPKIDLKAGIKTLFI